MKYFCMTLVSLEPTHLYEVALYQKPLRHGQTKKNQTNMGSTHICFWATDDFFSEFDIKAYEDRLMLDIATNTVNVKSPL